jgi:putative membrane protein
MTLQILWGCGEHDGMPAMNHSPFSQSDLDRITEAVRSAESKTSGEIVPYFVTQSDDYSIARWRGGVALAAIAMLVTLAFQMMSKTWLPLGVLELSGTIVGAFILGILLVRAVPSVRRLMLGHALMDHRVSQRASVAFLSEEVFKTRERTGILIFLSFFERRVIVLGDSGVNAKVAQSDWQGIVHTIVKSVKQGKPADGLVDAIRQCGDLLQTHGVERLRDDTDELSDSLRIG